MRVRFAPLAALLLLVPLACSKDDPAAPTGPETVLPLEARFPIDGVVPDLAAVGTVRQVNVTLRDAVGQGAEVAQTTLRWAVANDERAVYLAALWFDPSWNHDFTFEDGPVDFDGLRLLFDDAATGTLDLGDDSRTVIAALSGSQYVDAHVANPGEDETDHVGDGFAKLHYDDAQGLYSAEFLIPLADDAHGEDGPLDAASRYNLMVMQHVRLATLEGDVGTAYPMETGTASWPRLDLADVVVTDRPAIPSGLDGLLVFISDHEEPLGEIYSFDPATGVTARVSTLPALFKDNVSLSHDRRRVAFHGAPSREAVGEYEIYTLDIDGTNLRQLTDNAITERMRIAANGRLGIGTTAPSAQLHTTEIMQSDVGLRFGDPGMNSDLMYIARVNPSNDHSQLYIGLGDNPGQAPNPGDELIIDAGGSAQFIFRSNGDAYKTGFPAWGTISDELAKHDIESLTNTGVLDRLLKLKGRTFFYNEPDQPGAAPGKRTGFVAQEVEPVFPEWVGSTTGDMKTLGISGFEALTVEALRDLRNEKDAQIAALEKENTDLRARLDALEKLVGWVVGEKAKE